jgi:NADH:ubiquinone oxidoreductase subunit B-like Fe-S oxidoreductase
MFAAVHVSGCGPRPEVVVRAVSVALCGNAAFGGIRAASHQRHEEYAMQLSLVSRDSQR